MTVKWNGAKILRLVKDIADDNEEESAKRIGSMARSFVPRGKVTRAVATRGKHRGKSWTARTPGSLLGTIEINVSKFKDMGYIVRAGSSDIFYASFVELGTPGRGIAKRPYLRKALKIEQGRFWNNLKRAFK